MKTDAPTITCLVSSRSLGNLRAAEMLAREKSSPDRISIDSARAFYGGSEHRATRNYRLSDCFSQVEIAGIESSDVPSFKIVFHVREGADRYWKDIMAEILGSIQQFGVSITPSR